MKKTVKTLLIAFFGLFIAFALAVVIAPTFFKDKLIVLIKKEINARVVGEVDFSNIDVTWWSTFPDVAVEVENLRVTGNKVDSLQPALLKADNMSLGLDFMSIWSQGDSLEIKSFHLQHPVAYIHSDKNGNSNYDLVALHAEKQHEPSSTIKFDLSEYVIENIDLTYIDEESGVHITISDADHKGSLTYQTNNLLIDASLTSKAFHVKQNGITFLQAVTEFDGVVNFDFNENRYTFLENNLVLNALQLFVSGTIQQYNDEIDFDVNVNTRQNTFKSFLSILPNMYVREFSDVDASGKLILSGFVKGVLNTSQGTYPNYGLDLQVDNGFFQFPGKSHAISDIFITGNISNQGVKALPSLINLPLFQFKLNREEIAGNIRVNNQSTNQFFEGKANGKLNLKDLHEAYPFPDINEMQGELHADIMFKGNTKAIQARDLSQLIYTGSINGKNVRYAADGQPRVDIAVLESIVADDRIVVKKITGKIGRSDIEGTATISPLSRLVSGNDQPIRVTADVTGSVLDINEWLTPDETTTNLHNPSDENELIKNLQLEIKGAFNSVRYEDYLLQNISSTFSGDLSHLEIKQFKGSVNQDKVQGNGNLSNIYGYTYRNETLLGSITLSSPSLKADNWMIEDEVGGGGSTVNTVYAPVPQRMNISINAHLGELVYDNIHINNTKGIIKIKNNKLVFDDVSGQTLGGEFKLNGYYAHDGVGDPLFKLAYDIQRFSFEQTFDQIKSTKFLLPIINFIRGTFNSTMVFEGSLQPGYIPNLASLDGQGLLETLHGNLVGSETLEKISTLLQLDELKSIPIDRSRNRFAIKDGGLTIEPFEQIVHDIHTNISGHHKLVGDMNYKIALTIPTNKFDDTGIPSVINDQLATVQDKLSQLGIRIKDTESIRIDVMLTGQLASPDIEVKLIDFSKAAAKEIIKEVVNNAVDQAKDSITNVTKTKIIDVVQGSNKDSTQKSIEDAVKDRAEAEVNKKIDEEIKPVKDTVVAKVEDVIKDKIDDELKDKADDILDGWNPFKKKKKGN